MIMNGKIFISIASYKDALLKNTILEAYNKAHNKDRLVFGIFEQIHMSDCLDLGQFAFRDQIRYVRVNPETTKGVCWARQNIQSMYNDEEYYFQIDAHMLFDSGWDEYLIQQFEEIKRYNPKPIITAYPAHFKHDMSLIVNYEPKDLWIVGTGEERNDKFEILGFCPPFGGPKTSEHNAVHGFHLGACFLFSNGIFVREVPYDDAIFFGGEEPVLSIRAWTHGYDIFHIKNLRTYHCWDKPYGGIVQRDFRGDQHLIYQTAAAEYIDKLVRHQIPDPYGLGTARTVEQYMKYSGLNYYNRKFKENPKMFTVPYYKKVIID